MRQRSLPCRSTAKLGALNISAWFSAIPHSPPHTPHFRVAPQLHGRFFRPPPGGGTASLRFAPAFCPSPFSVESRRSSLPRANTSVVPRESRRSLAVVPLIANTRYYGEATARLRGGDGRVSGNGPPEWRGLRDEWLGFSESEAGEWRITETRKIGKRRRRMGGATPVHSGRDPFHRVPDCGGRGCDYRAAAAGAAMRLQRGRGRGSLLAHQSIRQCAGRCESRWPCLLSARHTGQRKAR